MSRYRRLLLLLVGVGACLVLVLQTMGVDVWYSAFNAAHGQLMKQGRTDPYRDGTDANVISKGDVRTSQPQVLSEGTPGAQLVLGTTSITKTTMPDPGPKTGPTVGPIRDAGLSLQDIMLKVNKEKQSKPRNDLKPPKTMLDPEQLLQIMGSAIGSLPIQEPQKVVHVLVTTYFRSGSSFLGDILQQNWKTFYYFEPLHHMSDGLRINQTQVPEALSLLKDLMYCNFTSPETARYLLWASDQKNTFLVRRNRFLWVACRMQPQLCFRPDFVRFVCIRAPWQVMKVNRLSLQQAGKFVLNNPELDIRVLHLVRDPRGIMSSRKVLGWCNSTRCSDFRVLCSEMDSDYHEFQRLKKLRPDRFFQVRYEDLSLKPQPVTQHVFTSLGLPYTNSVGKFLKLNTKARPVDVKDPYSTRRDSSRTPFEWRRKMKIEDIKKLQIGCSSVLKNYDYNFVNSSTQLTGDPQMLYTSEKSIVRT